LVINYKNYNPKIANNTFIAANSTIIGRCTIGENSSVWFNVTIRADVNKITIGRNVNIQDGSVIHCDHEHAVSIADNVTIGHNATIHGCNIRSNCIIGMGATILDGATIGENSIIGANSLITTGKQIPSGYLIMGSPAKVVRELSIEEVEGIKKSVEGYVVLSKEYTSEEKQV